MFGMFPLFALIVIAFNVVVFAGGSVGGDQSAQNGAQTGDQLPAAADIFSSKVVDLPMMSGDSFGLTVGGIFILASLGILFIEIVKSTRTDHSATMNHAFSMLIFVVCLIEFLMIKGFGNEYFLIITAMALIDVIAGYTVTISAARRDLGVSGGGNGASIF